MKHLAQPLVPPVSMQTVSRTDWARLPRNWLAKLLIASAARGAGAGARRPGHPCENPYCYSMQTSDRQIDCSKGRHVNQPTLIWQ